MTDPERADLQQLGTYWEQGYDWRVLESRLNELLQFRTTIDGLGIHYVYVRSPHPDAFPLVLTNGWPGSLVEYLVADVVGEVEESDGIGRPPQPASAGPPRLP